MEEFNFFLLTKFNKKKNLTQPGRVDTYGVSRFCANLAKAKS